MQRSISELKKVQSLFPYCSSLQQTQKNLKINKHYELSELASTSTLINININNNLNKNSSNCKSTLLTYTFHLCNYNQTKTTTTTPHLLAIAITLLIIVCTCATTATATEYNPTPSFVAAPTINLDNSPQYHIYQRSNTPGKLDIHKTCFNDNEWLRNFGNAITITNNWLVVASNHYVLAYKKVQTHWMLTQTFTPDSTMDLIKDVDANERFLVVSMAEDYNSAGDGRVYIYEIAADDQSWIQRKDLGADSDLEYFSTQRNPTNNQGTYEAGAYFGYSVSINTNNYLFVGAPFAYSAVFTYWLNGNGKWVSNGDGIKLFYGSHRNEAGRTIASNTKWMMTGSRSCNVIEIFKYDQAADTFPHHVQLVPPNAVRASKWFGYNIALTNDNFMVTSAPRASSSDCNWVKGYVYKYDESTSTWEFAQQFGGDLYNNCGNFAFGYQVAISADASRVFFGSQYYGLFSFKRVAGKTDDWSTGMFEGRHEHRAAAGMTQDSTDGYNEVGWGSQRGSFKLSLPMTIGNQAGGKLGYNPIAIAPNGDLAVVAGYNVLVYTMKSCLCNNGVCPADDTNSCASCNAGYNLNSGNCNTKSDCIVAGTGEPGTIDCANGGVSTGKTGSCSCTCIGGYSGNTCLVPDICSISNSGVNGTIDCVNGGSATGVTGNCGCSCPTGFSGTLCDILDACVVLNDGALNSINCLNGGNVQGVTRSCSCVCPIGFQGDATCAPSLCTVSDTGLAVAGTIDCINGGSATGVTGNCGCSCPTGFSGTLCDILDACIVSNDGALNSINCLNGGNVQGVTGSCTCSCTVGFVGLTCDTEDTSHVIQETSTKLEETKLMLNTTKDALREVITEINKLKEQNTTLTIERVVLQGEKNVLQGEKNLLQEEKNALQEAKNTLQEEKNTLQGEKTSLIVERDTLQGEKNTFVVEKTSLTEDKFDLRGRLDVALLNSTTLQQQVEALRLTLADSKKKMAENEDAEKNKIDKDKAADNDKDKVVNVKNKNDGAKSSTTTQTTSTTTTPTAATFTSPTPSSITSGETLMEQCDDLLVERTGLDSSSMMVFGFGFFVYVISMTLALLCFVGNYVVRTRRKTALLQASTATATATAQHSGVSVKIAPAAAVVVEKHSSQTRLMERLGTVPDSEQRANRRRSRRPVAGGEDDSDSGVHL